MHATQQPPAGPTRSLAQPLRDAADYLGRHGWCQHDYYADDTLKPPADVTGALALVCFGVPTTDLSMHHIPDEDLTEAERAFLCAVVILGLFIGLNEMVDARGNHVDYSISDWNDELHQSAAAVCAVLRAAADDYDRAGGSR